MKHSFLLVLALFTFAALARGQTTDAVVDVQRNIPYASPRNRPLMLDLYVPTNTAQLPPIIIYIHGGGWQAGDKSHPLPLPLTKQGFALASINYRLSQEAIFPAQMDDCKSAVRWVRANASKYHYNADKIGVVGDSAGGHLVALLGTTNNDPKLEGDEGNAGVSSAVQAVVDYYGPSDFISLPDQVTPQQRANLNNPVTHLFGTAIWNHGPVVAEEGLARMASPVYHVSASSCPFFIIHGDHDPIVPLQQSIELNAALKKAGVLSTLVVVKGGGHGFNDPPSALAAARFFKQQLGVPDQP